MTTSEAEELRKDWLWYSNVFLVVALISLSLVGMGWVESRLFVWLLFVMGVLSVLGYFVLVAAANTMRHRINSGEFNEEDQAA